MSFHLLKGHDFQRAQGKHLGCWVEMKKRSSRCSWAYGDCSIKMTGVMWLSAAPVMTDILKHNSIGLTELKVHSDNKALTVRDRQGNFDEMQWFTGSS